MSGWKWGIAGLVAAATLFGVGFLLGHRSATTGDAERRAWLDSTNVLLGAAKEAHLAQLGPLLAEVEAANIEIAKYRNSTIRERGEHQRWQAEADTLTAMLAFAETAADSLPLYQRIIEKKDSTIRADSSAIATLDTALGLSEQSKSVLLSVISTKDTRITALEEQLRRAPKGNRWELQLLGVRIRAGVGVVVTAGGQVRPAVGLFATP